VIRPVDACATGLFLTEVTRAQAPGFFRWGGLPFWEEFSDYVERARAEADAVMVNTFLEMEPEYVAGYAAARKMKVWTVGPASLYHHRGAATLASRGNTTAVDAKDCLGGSTARSPTL
jgi:UDP-glucosyltransferase 73C